MHPTAAHPRKQKKCALPDRSLYLGGRAVYLCGLIFESRCRSRTENVKRREEVFYSIRCPMRQKVKIS
jgi:hypothetical protein